MVKLRTEALNPLCTGAMVNLVKLKLRVVTRATLSTCMHYFKINTASDLKSAKYAIGQPYLNLSSSMIRYRPSRCRAAARLG